MIRTETALRVLVVDDEPPARDELAFQLGRLPEVASVAEAADASECMQRLGEEDVDVIFLDVRMPRLDGLDLARIVKRMAKPPLLVFVSAYDGYAVDAFGLAAVDYLLKPVRPDRLHVTVERLMAMRRGGNGAALAPQDEEASDSALGDRLAVLSRGQIVLVAIDDIRLAAVDGDHVVVRTHDGRYQARHTLGDLEQRLRGRGFLRVHRGHLVNLRHVLTIEAFFNGTYLLKLRDLPDLTVPVSRRHAAALRAAIRL